MFNGMYKTWVQHLGDEVGSLNLLGYKEVGEYNRQIPKYTVDPVPSERVGITFEINGETIKCFEVYLRRVEKFSEMLDGSWRANVEEKRAIIIPNTTNQAFKILLKYLESDNFDGIADLKDHVKDVWVLAKEIHFSQIYRPLVEHLEKIFDAENIIEFYTMAVSLETAGVPCYLLGLSAVTYIKQNLQVVSAKHDFAKMEPQMSHCLLVDLQQLGAFGASPSPVDPNLEF